MTPFQNPTIYIGDLRIDEPITTITDFLFIGIFSLVTLTSCSNEGNPEAVAEKFLNHINNGEFAEAKEYCDEQTASLIGMMESMAGDKKNELKDSGVKTEIISSEVKEDKATVKYKSTGGTKGATGAEQTLNLIKVDGKWKVTIDKENANKDGDSAPTDVKETNSLAVPADTIAPIDSTVVAE